MLLIERLSVECKIYCGSHNDLDHKMDTITTNNHLVNINLAISSTNSDKIQKGIVSSAEQVAQAAKNATERALRRNC